MVMELAYTPGREPGTARGASVDNHTQRWRSTSQGFSEPPVHSGSTRGYAPCSLVKWRDTSAGGPSAPDAGLCCAWHGQPPAERSSGASSRGRGGGARKAAVVGKRTPV
jgi:hypothetical protein